MLSGGDSIHPWAPPPRAALSLRQVTEQEVMNTSPDFRELPSNLLFPGLCQERLC